jgi:hypothetical protein
MFVDVECDAAGIDEAVTIGMTMADVMLVLMNVSTPGWTSRPEPKIAYRIDGAPPREIIAFVEGWSPGPRSARIDGAALDDLVGAWLRLPDEAKWRTIHAANSLRVAMRGDDAADRVPETYSGLEFLNPLLEGKHQYSGRGASAGLGGFIEQSRDAAFEERARLARNGIVHGKKAIAELATDLAVVDGPLVEVLRDAILSEVGAMGPAWSISAIDAPGMRGRIPLQLMGELEPNSAGEIAPPGLRHPVIELQNMNVSASSIDADGKYHMTGNPTYKIGLAEGATLRITQARVPRVPGAEVTLSDLRKGAPETE